MISFAKTLKDWIKNKHEKKLSQSFQTMGNPII